MLTEADKQNLQKEEFPKIIFDDKEKEFSTDDLAQIIECLNKNKRAQSLIITQKAKYGIFSDPDNKLFSALVSHPSIYTFSLNITVRYEEKSGLDTLPRTREGKSMNEYKDKLNEKLKLKAKLFKLYNKMDTHIQASKQTNQTNIYWDTEEKFSALSSAFTALKDMKKIQDKNNLLPNYYTQAQKQLLSHTFNLNKQQIAEAMSIEHSKEKISLEKYAQHISKISQCKDMADFQRVIKSFIKEYDSFLNTPTFVQALKIIEGFLNNLTKEELDYAPQITLPSDLPQASISTSRYQIQTEQRAEQTAVQDNFQNNDNAL